MKTRNLVIAGILCVSGFVTIVGAFVAYRNWFEYGSRVCAAHYGNLRFIGDLLPDRSEWEYRRVSMTIDVDKAQGRRPLCIWHFDKKFTEEGILDMVKQTGWIELPPEEAWGAQEIRVESEIVSAWRSPAYSYLMIREDGTKTFEAGPGDHVALEIHGQRIDFPIRQHVIDGLLGPPDRIETRPRYERFWY